jgi:hypothetical protein
VVGRCFPARAETDSVCSLAIWEYILVTQFETVQFGLCTHIVLRAVRTHRLFDWLATSVPSNRCRLSNIN